MKLPIKWIGFCLGLTIWLNLFPRPLPDFISQLWRKPKFSPQLWDEIWCPGYEAMFDYGHASVRLYYVSWLVIWYSWPLIYLASPYMCRMARQHCILQAGKAMTRLWSFSSRKKLMWTIRPRWGLSCECVCVPSWGVTSLMSKTHGSVTCITMNRVIISHVTSD